MGTSMKPEGWEGRLGAFLADARGRKFRWGIWDCCLFAAGAVEAITGIDPAAELRGKYMTKKEARLLMSDFAGGGVSETIWRIASGYGCKEVSVLTAQRGDIVIAETSLGDALGVIGMDGRFALFAGPEGVTTLPVSVCRNAWRI